MKYLKKIVSLIYLVEKRKMRIFVFMVLVDNSIVYRKVRNFRNSRKLD